MAEPEIDEVQARIQEFTSWAADQGYHVVGALMRPRMQPQVKVFCSAPEGNIAQQTEHLKKMVEALYLAVFKGKDGQAVSLSIGLN